MRRFLVVVAAGLGLVAGSATVVGAASGRARPAYCGITWGSLLKQDPAMTTVPITNVRAGRHACFDRLVVDLAAPVSAPGPQANGYHAGYVAQVTEDGSGAPVALAGGAFIQSVVRANNFDVNTGTSTYAPADRARIVNVSGFRTFRQAAFAGTFEGQTTFGLGVRARLPFRVFALAGPGSGRRVVIDVAHRW
ncbi:MAG: AMIN-like domain-containing (lipo)protein [Acidimicrobiales bacterium]